MMDSGKEINREILVYKIKDMQPKESKTNWHFYLSMAKSGLRIVAGVALMFQDFELCGLFFIIAETLGIAEEL